MLDAFRNEIVEAEKGRMDLLRWKLILVAALGTVGLGFNVTENSQPVMSAHLVLCLVPFICVFIDALCKHLQLRILVISDFFQRFDSQNCGIEISCFSQYEKFCEEIRAKPRAIFSLEDWAIDFSTLALSGLVILASFLLEIPPIDYRVLFYSGVAGIVFSIVVQKQFQYKRRSLLRFAEEKFAKSEAIA